MTDKSVSCVVTPMVHDEPLNDRLGCAPWQGGAFQWVQVPPGNLPRLPAIEEERHALKLKFYLKYGSGPRLISRTYPPQRVLCEIAAFIPLYYPTR